MPTRARRRTGPVFGRLAAAAIQLADSTTRPRSATSAPRWLVSASPTAMRAEAAGRSAPAASARPSPWPRRHGCEAGQRHRDVGHRHLPRADHLVASHEAGDGAVADGDQELLVGDAGNAAPAPGGLAPDDGQPGRSVAERRAANVARIMRGGLPSSTSAADRRGSLPNRVVTTSRRLEPVASPTTAKGQRSRRQRRRTARDGPARRQHVALLGLVAPDLERRHARVGVGIRAQLETRRRPAVLHQLPAARSTGRRHRRRG
jgi:hypothetical protein